MGYLSSKGLRLRGAAAILLLSLAPGLLVDGTLAEVLASVKSLPIVCLRVADRVDEAMQTLKELPFVQQVYPEG